MVWGPPPEPDLTYEDLQALFKEIEIRDAIWEWENLNIDAPLVKCTSHLSSEQEV